MNDYNRGLAILPDEWFYCYSGEIRWQRGDEAGARAAWLEARRLAHPDNRELRERVKNNLAKSQ
jgi:hypothetical protein